MLVDPPEKRQEYFRKTPIDGQILKNFIEASLTWLRTNQQIVNSLNVFPVPDGDTGTNMVLTMQAAYDEISGSAEHYVGKMAHSIAHGALMGARGNSGVILSQLWRGFARALDHKTTLDAGNLVRALAVARDTAYKGVVRPVEGTILTVAKDIAKSAEDTLKITDDLVDILEAVVKAADESVQRTPDLLPVLKDAGVVDSGGKGLFFIFEGMLRYINGLSLDTALLSVQPLSAINLENTMETIEPGQDFEVVVDFRPRQPLDLVSFYEDLEQMGTSIQVGEGDGIYRLHIHVPTEKRYYPIDYDPADLTEAWDDNQGGDRESDRPDGRPGRALWRRKNQSDGSRARAKRSGCSGAWFRNRPGVCQPWGSGNHRGGPDDESKHPRDHPRVRKFANRSYYHFAQ